MRHYFCNHIIHGYASVVSKHQNFKKDNFNYYYLEYDREYPTSTRPGPHWCFTNTYGQLGGFKESDIKKINEDMIINTEDFQSNQKDEDSKQVEHSYPPPPVRKYNYTQPDESTEQPDDNIEQPDDSTEQPDDSTEQPDDSTEQPDESIQKPDDSTEQPDESIQKPDDSTEQPDNTQTLTPKVKKQYYIFLAYIIVNITIISLFLYNYFS